MTYTEFEKVFLGALSEEADRYDHGQVLVFSTAEAVAPGVDERWVLDAVRSYEERGLVRNVLRTRDLSRMALMITGEGRRVAEALDGKQ